MKTLLQRSDSTKKRGYLLRLALACALSGAACGGQRESPAQQASAVTYHEHVAPIVAAKCAGCHHQDGIAPFALETYEQAAAYAMPIRYAVAARVMPPWPPSSNCREYQHDRSLSAEQIDTITRWIDGGAPAGEPASAPESATPRKELPRTDLVVKLPEAYTPRARPDEYRCFVIDWPAETDRYVIGYEGRPGNARIVHHIIAYVATPESLAKFEALDAADDQPGYSCFGGPNGDGPPSPAPWLGGWTPGALPTELPAGLGLKIRRGSKLILQIHYNTAGGLDSDQSEVAYMLADQVEKEARLLPFANPSWVNQRTMNIAAGDPRAQHEFAGDPAFLGARIFGDLFQAGVPITVWSSILHMHTRGTSALLEVVHDGDQRECLLDIRRWNFHWQGAYAFREPAVIEPGELVHLACRWNNSAETRELNWGEGTADEMCLGGLLITQ